MKKMRLVKLMGSCSLALMLAVSGCSSATETTEETSKAETTTTTTEETSEETEQETTESTESPEVTEPTEAFDFSAPMEPGYLCDHQVFSDGQLEDQLVYMNEFPGYENIDFDSLPDDFAISDLSVIEDEDLRAIAQEYQDNGYTIEDPSLDIECGFGIPCDGQYVFNNGFYAYSENGRVLETFTACKMNEELFNFFIVGYFYCEHYEMSDDGTVIMYTDGNNYCEFNRDTGIATEYSIDISDGEG